MRTFRVVLLVEAVDEKAVRRMLKRLDGVEETEVSELSSHANAVEPEADHGHSVACGLLTHPHGAACAWDCPTCGGVLV